MNKGMIKSTFREIRTSLGRYMAILLIVALGVGFFSGLKVSYETMIHTADQYWKDQNMFDYQLLSTIGFDEDAVETLKKEEDVTAAEGSKSADILMMTEDNVEVTIKTMQLTDEVNKVVLTDGRMPENETECLADRHNFDEGDIGKKLIIADTNEEEDSDLFAVKEYTIVGLVRSPLYVLSDRGTTDVGNGSIEGYIYLQEAAYDMDYDTEIYVTFNKDAVIYSDEYEAYMSEEKEKQWETICENIANARYERIYAEAMEEITDAEDTLLEKKTDGEKELEDALEELNDGKTQLEDGQNAIKTAKNTLNKNEKTLEEKEKDYKSGLASYKKSKKQYDKGKKSYDAGVKSYNEQYAEYEKGLKAYNEGLAEYNSSEEQYQTAKEQYEAGKDYMTEEQQKKTEQELSVWRTTLDETAKTLTATKTELDTAGQSLKTAKATLDATGKQLKSAKKQLDSAKKKLDSAEKQIAEAKEQFADARKQISEKEVDLEEAKQELADGEKEYEDAKAEFDEKIADAQEEIEDGKEELRELEQPDIYVLGRETNTGYASFENDSAIVEGVAKVFPIFFFLVAAMVCMTTMSRMIEEQRTQIGVLKALGYSNGAIIGKYVTYSGSAALIGSVGGFFAGTWIFSLVIWFSYKMMYDMGDMIYVLDLPLALLATLVAFLCSAGTTFVVCYQELKEMAAALMRPKAPKIGKRVLLEKIPVIWNRLKFLDKVSVRNLFRYKRRFFMMIIGVSGCTALLVAGLGVKDSIGTIAETQYNTISLYDMLINVDGDVDAVDGVERSLKILGKSADLYVEDKVKGVNLLVPESNEDFACYMNLATEDGEALAMPGEQEVLLPFKLARQYDIQTGDTIRLQNSEMKGGTVKVTGIYISYIDHYIIMQPETYEQLFGEMVEYNEMFVNVKEEADIHQVSTKLMKQDAVTRVTISEDVREQITDMLSSLYYVVILVIACAAMLAFIVIYNLNNINITERMREIATVKVLGFYKEETNSYVFRENILLTFIGSLLGAFLGHYLHAFVLNQINVDMVEFDVHVEPLSYLLSVVLTLLFNQIVNWVMSGKLERIDMAESLKSVE